MKEDYKVTVVCKNCGHHQTLHVEWGKLRPIDYHCENCGCGGSTNCIYN